MKARTEWWFVLLAFLPALATASVYAEAFVASRALGHWPIPSVEDPKDLVTAPLHGVSTFLVLTLLPGAILFAAITLKNWRLLRNPSRYWVWIAVFGVLLFINLWLGRHDSRTWAWWWD